MIKRSNNIILIGRNIRKYRMFKEIKQGDLAKAIGVTRSTLSHYENGVTKISFSQLTVIAEILKITMNDLMKETE